MNRCPAPGCPDPPAVGPFCATHAAAPAGKRGGWLSAAKRRPYDANAIAPRLWIGATPPFDRDLPQVDLLVLCARELQPEQLAFKHAVIRCPIPDGALTEAQQVQAVKASTVVALAVAEGKRALVTCAMGLNRSALVAGLALGQMTTMSAGEIVAHVRKHRGPSALNNPMFRELLERVIGAGRARAKRRTDLNEA